MAHDYDGSKSHDPAPNGKLEPGLDVSIVAKKHQLQRQVTEVFLRKIIGENSIFFFSFSFEAISFHQFDLSSSSIFHSSAQNHFDRFKTFSLTTSFKSKPFFFLCLN